MRSTTCNVGLERAHRTGGFVVVFLLLVACNGGPASEPASVKPEEGKADSSVQGVFLRFDFDGEVYVRLAANHDQLIRGQLLYTVGHLNGDGAVGRMERLELSQITSEPAAGGMVHLRYRASLPVVWGDRDHVPQSYTFTLPRDVSEGGLIAFTQKYHGACVDWDAHDVIPENMWFYYKPGRSVCKLKPEDVVSFSAAVSPTTVGTTGKYPEYHKMWEDGVLRVVAAFGKFQYGATAETDLGIKAYNLFLRYLRQDLAPHGYTTTPANLPNTVGINYPVVTVKSTLPDGKRLELTAFLVEGMVTTGYAFHTQYPALSQRADLIAFSGHSSMGASIRALASRGEWVPGQYVMIFMNGCDSFAYVDDTLFAAHAAVNPDDPKGTRHTDIIMNGMPTWFEKMTSSTLTLVRALLRHDLPKNYEQIFAEIDPRQLVLVSGEEDNVFVPGSGGGEGAAPWSGLDEQGTLSKGQEVRFATPRVPAGRYRFTMTGTGDADLYLRAGTPPSTTLYDCRPYLKGSDEICAVEIPVDAPLHALVRGYASSSAFHLVASPAE